MKGLVLIGLLGMALAGCGRSNGDSAKGPGGDSAEKKQETPQGTIRMDERAQQLAGIQVVEAQAREIPETLTAAGQIVMDEERTSHIGSYSSGRITEVHANVGDSVKRGAVLARMHSHEVHETIAAYQTALQNVRRQQSALDFGVRTRGRMQRLYALKSASLQEVEKAETDVRGLETNLADAKISVDREVAHLSDLLHVSNSALNHIDETMEQVPVISPIAGIVTARMITPGSVVEPGQEVYTVADLSDVWMMASVAEPDIAKVKTGEHATITSQAFPERQFSGTVARLNAELDPKTRTLPVRLVVPNPAMRLRASMYANAQIEQGQSRAAIFIPEEALQEINGGSMVFVRKAAEEFEARPVQVAHHINGQAEIAAGLKAGETIIVRGSFVAKSEMLKSQIGE